MPMRQRQTSVPSVAIVLRDKERRNRFSAMQAS
jgi:hypothetical protein